MFRKSKQDQGEERKLGSTNATSTLSPVSKYSTRKLPSINIILNKLNKIRGWYNYLFMKIVQTVHLKGLYALFLVNLHEEMTLSDSQQYPEKLCLILNV